MLLTTADFSNNCHDKDDGEFCSTRGAKKRVTVSAKVAKKVPASAKTIKSDPVSGGPLPHKQLVTILKKTLTTHGNATQATQEALDARPQAKPHKVSKEEFAALKKSDPDGISVRSAPAKAHKELIDGERHIMSEGSDYWGEGTYFGAGKNALKHVTESYHNSKNAMLESHIDTSKVMEIKDLDSIVAHASRLAAGQTRAQVDKAIKGVFPKIKPENEHMVAALAAALKDSGLGAGIKAGGDKYYFGDTHASDRATVAAMLGIPGFVVRAPAGVKGLDYISVIDRSIITVPA